MNRAPAPHKTNLSLWERAIGAFEAGDESRSEKLLEKLLAKHPKHYQALYLMGKLNHQRRDFAEACDYYEKAAQVSADHAQLLVNYGAALLALNDCEKAAEIALKAIHLDEDKEHQARAYDILGCAMVGAGHLKQAVYIFRDAINHAPTLIHPYNNLGDLYSRLEDYPSALKTYKAGLAIQPKDTDLLLNAAAALLHLNDFEGAAQFSVEVLRLAPENAAAYSRLADALNRMGKLDGALAAAKTASTLAPGQPRLLWNRALLELQAGNLPTGWKLYHEGLKTPARRVYSFGLPLWDGEAGKSVIALAEQGIGDEMIFASCFSDLSRDTEKCVITCDSRLAQLFERSFPEIEFIPTRNEDTYRQLDISGFDCELPIGELPRLYRNSLSDFPREAYLTADAKKKAHWHSQLAQLGSSPKVGVIWRSGLMTTARHASYVSLEQFARLLQVPGIQFINLTYAECSDELRRFKDEFGVDIYDPELDQKDDIDGVAALVSNLDLAVGVGTAPIALAGAVGTPTWGLYPTQSTFGDPRGYMPWYPNYRVFAPEIYGEWDGVMDRIVLELASLFRQNRGPNV